MQDKITLLEKIQRIDLEIDSIEEEKLYYPFEINKIEKEIEGIDRDLEALKMELNEMGSSIKAVEDDIMVCVERIKKNEERLNIIKNEKELNAITKEINAAKKEKINKENEVAKLRGRFDEKNNIIMQKEEGVREGKAKIEEIKKEFDAKKEKWDEALKSIKEERRVIANELPPMLVKRYNSIREKRQGIAIAKVKHGTCQGCYISIPPQMYIQIRKGANELIFCPHCHRILYFESLEHEGTNSLPDLSR